jgi:hypothetical protein
MGHYAVVAHAGSIEWLNPDSKSLFCIWAVPDMGGGTVAWALYDGARPADEQMQAGSQGEPPYASVLDAMCDGWRVVQLPSLPSYARGTEYETAPLPWEYVLERMVSLDSTDE